MKLSQLIAAIGVAATGLIGFSGAAQAAPASAAAESCVTTQAATQVLAAPESPVTSDAPCDPATCVDGVLTVITDDSGVQHQACVASAGVSQSITATAVSETPVVSQRASLGPVAQQDATASRSLPTTGAGTGGMIIAAVLVGSGSVVSLLSRRRPVSGRKRFRRRNATP